MYVLHITNDDFTYSWCCFWKPTMPLCFLWENLIKQMKRNRLSIEHSNYLKQVLLNGPKMHDMQWDSVFDIQEDANDWATIDCLA